MERPLHFRLAPMSTALRVMTWLLFALPLGFTYAAVVAPGPARLAAAGIALFVILIYASVWFIWRPTRFDLGGTSLRIVWPTWSRVVELSSVRQVETVTAAEFRKRYGYGLRVGAGGLWGGFGLLKTGSETFSMWVSRTDAFVLVWLTGARPLMLTPEEPEVFAAALRERAAHFGVQAASLPG